MQRSGKKRAPQEGSQQRRSRGSSNGFIGQKGFEVVFEYEVDNEAVAKAILVTIGRKPPDAKFKPERAIPERTE